MAKCAVFRQLFSVEEEIVWNLRNLLPTFLCELMSNKDATTALQRPNFLDKSEHLGKNEAIIVSTRTLPQHDHFMLR